jgi:hypothetical protein
MKAIVLFCTVVLAVARPTVADAASANACAQIVQKITDSAAAIAADADAYWAHRANFVALIFGPPNAAMPVVPDKQAADQEKGQADTLKGGTPGKLASFKGQVTAALATGCLSPAQLSAIVEPAIKLAKRVNFDQFPPDEQLEDPTGPAPSRMPKN